MSFLEDLPPTRASASSQLRADMHNMDRLLGLPRQLEQSLEAYARARAELESLHRAARPGWVSRKRGALDRLAVDLVRALRAADDVLEQPILDGEYMLERSRTLVAVFRENEQAWQLIVSEFESNGHRAALRLVEGRWHKNAYDELTEGSRQFPDAARQMMQRHFERLREREAQFAAGHHPPDDRQWHEADLAKLLGLTDDGRHYLSALRLTLGDASRAAWEATRFLESEISRVAERAAQCEAARAALSDAFDRNARSEGELANGFDVLLRPMSQRLARLCSDEHIEVSSAVADALRNECAEDIRVINRAVLSGETDLLDDAQEARSCYDRLVDATERFVMLRAMADEIEAILENHVANPSADPDLLRAIAALLHDAQVARDERHQDVLGTRAVLSDMAALLAARVSACEVQ